MQEKKELLEGLLKKIQPYRELAEGILLLLAGDKIDENMIDYLFSFLSKVIKKIEIQGNAGDSLERMYQKELEEKKALRELRKNILGECKNTVEFVALENNKVTEEVMEKVKRSQQKDLSAFISLSQK